MIQIGKQGLSTEIQSQIDRQLLDHELIKVRVLDSSPTDCRQCARELEASSAENVAQIIGKTLILYRQHPEKPKIQLPE